MRHMLLSCIMFLYLLLTGCGPSAVELAATSVSLTETAKPTATATPTPTHIPTSTATPKPTKTPIPNPQSSCKLTSVSQVPNSVPPSFQYEAEGFTAGERLFISLEGGRGIAAQFNNADDEGRIRDYIVWNIIGFGSPAKFKLTIEGESNNCTTSQSVRLSP